VTGPALFHNQIPNEVFEAVTEAFYKLYARRPARFAAIARGTGQPASFTLLNGTAYTPAEYGARSLGRSQARLH